MTTAPTTSARERTLGVVDVALFMVTASCTLQWTAAAAAIGPSSLVIWLLVDMRRFSLVALPG
jgi:hypothetical protein